MGGSDSGNESSDESPPKDQFDHDEEAEERHSDATGDNIDSSSSPLPNLINAQETEVGMLPSPIIASDEEGETTETVEDEVPPMTTSVPPSKAGLKMMQPPKAQSKSVFSFKGLKKMLGLSSNSHEKKYDSSNDSEYNNNNNSTGKLPMPSPSTTSNIPLRRNNNQPISYYPKRIHTVDWDTKPACAVIVTIYTAFSFDQLFRAVVQQSPDPESSIALFEMDYATIPTFLEYLRLNGDLSGDGRETMIEKGKAIKQVMDAIEQVSPNSVVFNFECCNHCSDNGFTSCQNMSRESHHVMQFMKALLDAGFMVMVGDFSLKALIHDWDASLLGPNPFDRVGTCEKSMTIAFDSQQLLSCPSGQLQNVGKLNDGISTADIHCMNGTITCTLKEESAYTKGNDFYDLEVLTIAAKLDGKSIEEGSSIVGNLFGNGKKKDSSAEKKSSPAKKKSGWFSSKKTSSSSATTTSQEDNTIQQQDDSPTPVETEKSESETPTAHNDNPVPAEVLYAQRHRLLKIGEYKGFLGHALLKYKSGGLLLVSTGHWIELSRLDAANEERVLTAIREQYGEVYTAQLDEEFRSCGNDTAKKKAVINRATTQLVQSSAPCSYSKRSKW